MNIPTVLPPLLVPEACPAPATRPDVLMVDVCGDEVYRQVHPPGAVHVSPGELVSGQQPAPGGLPPLERMQATLERIGLQPGQHVIAYDDEGGGWAGRLLWTLEMLGLKSWSYLNGGLRAWLDAGLPATQEVPDISPTQLTLAWQDGAAVDMDYLLAHLDDPALAIWDARSPGEYDGSHLHARRGGHIPGAVNYEWTRGMDSTRSLRVRDLEVIRRELAELGIRGDQTVVTHCQTHHRSGFTWLLGRLLGFPDMRAYPGSWSEWGNHPATPIANGTTTHLPEEGV